MIEQIMNWMQADVWWSYLLRLALLFLGTWLVYHFSWHLADRILRAGRIAQKGKKLRPERFATLRSLIASAIVVLAVIVALILALSQFVPAETLLWMVGLFSAAFGLGARPIISDFLTGISFLFEDPYGVGEKVELLEVEGVVEGVNLRTTSLRAPTGELLIIPNGDVRVVRNFSRGLFSLASVKLKIAAVDLPVVLPLLEQLGQEAVLLLPNLLEPWQVISETGEIGQQTELTMLAKARYGKGAEMRPRLLALVQEQLAEAGVTLAD